MKFTLKKIKTQKFFAIFFIVSAFVISCFFSFNVKDKKLSPPREAEAMYRYDPSVGVLVTGTTAPILGATAPAAEGVNVGDWRGAEADDNLHWGFTSTASGYNAYFDISNVKLRGANKFLIQTEFDLDATVPSTYVQICDWVSNVGVDNGTDAQCTGGGWRTVNVNDTAITSTTATAYDFEIYDGYWSSSATTSISTPLLNFINSSGNVRIRYFSTTNTTSVVNIDYIRLFVVIDPVYSASSATIISGGTPTGGYASTTIGGAGQTGSDNAYFTVPGTASSISNFYLSYENVKPYGGANTILYRAEYSCSTTGINIKPKIYNYSTRSWEDLTTGTIACSATDATNAWAKDNVNITDYIQDGEIRIGWYGSGNSTVGIRIDISYITIGTVTNGNSQITFGTLSAGVAGNTSSLDMTASATSTWDILDADESNTQSFASYANDGDNDATVEEAAAANLNFTVIPPSNSSVTGVFFAGRFMSGIGGTVQLGIADAGGITAATGGWTAVGSTATTQLTYTDNIQSASVLSGGAAGIYQNPGNHIDYSQSRINMRLRTTSSGATSNNSIAKWDFAMVSIQWIENPNHRSGMSRYDVSGGGLVTGTTATILGATAAAAEGVNMGDWRGAEADDNLHWGFTSTSSGFNAYLDITGVSLNGANSFIIQTEFDLDATAPSTYVQICDWVSSTGVTNAADTQCTGGGWRNLNTNDTPITTTTATAYSWQLYNGYWNSTATTKIDTPLSNFIDGTGKIRIRYYSTTNTTSLINIDYLRMFAVVQPVYFASGATQITGGTITGDYSMTTTAGAGQTGSDNAYFTVPGTASSISDFYLSYTNVKTYSGADTILYRAEYSCSTTGINIRPKIYNFTSAQWENLSSAVIACSTTDATNAWAKSGININDYISGGEVRIGWFGSGNSTVSIRLDLAYMMIGTVTNGTSQISFGTLSSGSAADTKSLDMSSTTAATWKIAAADESNTQSFASYAYDGDNDATVEEASAANIDFTLIPPDSTQVTGVLFAGRYMSGVAGTVNIGIADAGGLISVQGGWTQVGANSTTALTYSDSISVATVASGGHAGLYFNAYDYVDADTGRMNMRLRTSSSGATTNNSIAQWDFAMISLQWTEVPLPPSTISFNISDPSIGFGNINYNENHFATNDSVGTTSQVVAHTIDASSNSPGGYVITLTGTSLTSGSSAISTIGQIPAAGVPGSEQFGINVASVGGYGVSLPPYNRPGYFAFTTSTQNVIAANYSSDNTNTTYNVSYLANISPTTPAGSYNSVMTYTITASF